MDEMTLTLNSPITEEQWDAITDVDFERTDRIRFSTKHGKKVEFVKAPQWTPVTERLPEEKGEYLVTYHPSYWDEVSAETKVGIDSFRGKSSWAKKKYQRVTAWAVLPEPYKEDDE